MRPGQFTLSCLLGMFSVLVVVAIIYISQKNRELEHKAKQQIVEINKGTLSRQVGINLLRDMATVSTRNARIREILLMNGYSVTENSTDPVKR